MIYFQKAKSVFEDEDYMTQVYGKASYQKGRTTVKDPYLHFQNVPKHKAERPAGIVESKGNISTLVIYSCYLSVCLSCQSTLYGFGHSEP